MFLPTVFLSHSIPNLPKTFAIVVCVIGKVSSNNNFFIFHFPLLLYYIILRGQKTTRTRIGTGGQVHGGEHSCFDKLCVFLLTVCKDCCSTSSILSGIPNLFGGVGT